MTQDKFEQSLKMHNQYWMCIQYLFSTNIIKSTCFTYFWFLDTIVNKFNKYLINISITRLRVSLNTFITFTYELIIGFVIMRTVKDILKMSCKSIRNTSISNIPININIFGYIFLNLAFQVFQNSGMLLFIKWWHISFYCACDSQLKAGNYWCRATGCSKKRKPLPNYQQIVLKSVYKAGFFLIKFQCKRSNRIYICHIYCH